LSPFRIPEEATMDERKAEHDARDGDYEAPVAEDVETTEGPSVSAAGSTNSVGAG
jgi:hypothetical protein